MRVLLLGSNGQLGSDICRRAGSEGGLELNALSRADLDLADLEAIDAVLRRIEFDVLINATGFHKTDDVESQAQTATVINAHAPLRLARVCAGKGARFVHLSTDYVFGGQAKREPLTESDAPAPLNVYGATKLMGEALAATAGADLIVARVSSLFGVAGASGKGGNFVETMIRLAKEKGALKVVSDQIMAPTATADIAEALLRLISARAPAGVYHVVGSGQASWFDFAKEIVARAGLGHVPVEPVPTSQMPTPAMRPPYSVLSNGKLTQTLGWAMPTWRDALQRYLVAKGHAA
ncbi:MAG TPA: dTDP-4-dehydrorhamnose reductase [Methylocystis sp.]|nr:dTDP-4-dehydrorhamnose reductase [Methylocystis sp.]